MTEDDVNPFPISKNEPDTSEDENLRFSDKWPVWPLAIGIFPFVLSLLFRGGASGWANSFDGSSLGFSLFAISLAGSARVRDLRRNQDYHLVFMICAIFQVLTALYLSGVFRVSVPRDATEKAYALYKKHLDVGHSGTVRQIVNAMYQLTHLGNPTFYCILAVTGALSVLALLRCWTPPPIPAKIGSNR